MPRPPNPTTKEAVILTGAFAAMHNGAKAELAGLLEVSPAAVSQYASGNRPVPWDKAAQVAAFTGTEPADISAAYRDAFAYFGKLFSASQPARLDADMMTAAEGLVRKKEQRHGELSLAVRGQELVEAYALLVEHDRSLPRQVATRFVNRKPGGSNVGHREGKPASRE